MMRSRKPTIASVHGAKPTSGPVTVDGLSMAHVERPAHRACLIDSGFTLIELTVVLSVIVTLALMLIPAVANFLNDSRAARARVDVRTIADAIARFYKDNGFYPQWSTAQNGGPGTQASKIDVLVSPGNVPSSSDSTVWTTGATDALGDQLMTNAPTYALRTAGAQFGWNGPYLSSEFGPDSWANRYMVNIGLLDPTPGAAGEGGATKSAVWVVSAGPNGAIETAYSQTVLKAVLGGDDIGLRLQ